MSEINLNTTREDALLIRKIAGRACEIDTDLRVLDVSMDLAACHLNGCPLDLKRMAEWERDFDVMHDVYGLRNTIERDESKPNAGQIVGLFRPRFAMRKT